MAFGFHISLRPKNSVSLLRTVADRRTVARVVLERGRDFDLTSFSAAASHLHAHNGGDRGQSVELARRIQISLARSMPEIVGFYAPYVEPIQDEKHLYRTFRYILGQDKHHQLAIDPLREASNLPDLLGLRPLGRYTAATVQQWLPAIRGPELVRMLQVEQLAEVPPHVPRTIEAGLAAANLCGLRGKGEAQRRLRHALLAILAPAVASSTFAEDIAPHLAITPRHVRRMIAAPHVDPTLVRAVRLQDSLLVQKGRRARSPSGSTRVLAPRVTDRTAGDLRSSFARSALALGLSAALGHSGGAASDQGPRSPRTRSFARRAPHGDGFGCGVGAQLWPSKRFLDRSSPAQVVAQNPSPRGAQSRARAQAQSRAQSRARARAQSRAQSRAWARARAPWVSVLRATQRRPRANPASAGSRARAHPLARARAQHSRAQSGQAQRS
jgi:hypothetical protein